MQAIKINPEDVVAVALTDLKQGQEVKLENDVVILKEDIPRGHALEAARAPLRAGAAPPLTARRASRRIMP